jgi:hypothetical protein
MELNSRWIKDEWLHEQTINPTEEEKPRRNHLNMDVNMVYDFPLSGWWMKWDIMKGRRTGICHAAQIPAFTATMA